MIIDGLYIKKVKHSKITVTAESKMVASNVFRRK